MREDLLAGAASSLLSLAAFILAAILLRGEELDYFHGHLNMFTIDLP